MERKEGKQREITREDIMGEGRSKIDNMLDLIYPHQYGIELSCS